MRAAEVQDTGIISLPWNATSVNLRKTSLCAEGMVAPARKGCFWIRREDAVKEEKNGEVLRHIVAQVFGSFYKHLQSFWRDDWLIEMNVTKKNMWRNDLSLQNRLSIALFSIITQHQMVQSATDNRPVMIVCSMDTKDATIDLYCVLSSQIQAIMTVTPRGLAE